MASDEEKIQISKLFIYHGGAINSSAMQMQNQLIGEEQAL